MSNILHEGGGVLRRRPVGGARRKHQPCSRGRLGRRRLLLGSHLLHYVARDGVQNEEALAKEQLDGTIGASGLLLVLLML